jgi:SAM-dependent MidA family methyltransferase
MNPLALQIHREIKETGPISFVRFMELALYAPGLGYYEKQREIGRHGDFFTSVSVGPLFGELLGFQFAQWLDSGHSSDHLQIIEAGAHQGILAADILNWMQRWRPDLLDRLQYLLIEPSAIHRAWQEQTLQKWLPNVKWISDIAELGPEPASRIIFGNELLDAIPVHRLSWNSHKWEECRVASENGIFTWQKADPSPELAKSLPTIGQELAAVLPQGFIVEVSPAAVAWWKKAAAALGRGKLLTIDYGFTGDQWLRPERSEGALRTFSRHHAGDSLLDHPGDCDITAHVNFSAIEAAGQQAGLATEALMRQEKFLTQILAQAESRPGEFEVWTPARIKQFQTLTHPEHLGCSFRVLVQSPIS